MYEVLFKNILFPLYETVLRRRNTVKYINQSHRTEFFNEEELQNYQWKALKRLLSHAYNHTGFYKETFDNVGLVPDKILTLNDFRKIPIISKTDIRPNKDRMIPDDYREGLFHKSTGGSTGEPLNLAHDRDSYERRVAIALRGYGWAGCEDGRRVVYIWGAPIGKVSKFQNFKMNMHNIFSGKTVFNSFDFDKEQMEKVLDEINRIKPHGIVGYTNALANFAQYIKDNDKICVPIESVITAAEKVYDHQRELFEDVFYAKVFNTYGCREFMLIASECEKHQGLHMNVDHLLIEILKDGKPALPGEVGEVVITDLFNYGMPFIRYKNGDLAKVSDRVCDCGRGLPLMEDVEGRSLDMIQTCDGKSVPGEFFPHLMKEFEEIVKFQVIQKEVHSVTIKIIQNIPFSDERMTFLNTELTKVLGMNMNINIEFVKDISVTSSGKFRVTISEL